MLLRSLSRLGFLVASAALVACGGSDTDPPGSSGPKPVEITSFIVAPASLAPGESAIVTWETQHAASLELFLGELPVAIHGESLDRGSVEVAPELTTVARLVATGRGGDRATKEVEIEVRIPAGPTVVSFVAEPDVVGSGQQATLRWQTSGAAAVRITDEQGGALDLGAENAAAGAVTVTPEETTTYELVAEGLGGSAQAQVTVKVVAAPTLVAGADPASIQAGETVRLHWESQDAEQIVVRVGETIILESSERLSDELVVSPSIDTVYTVVASGPGGAVSQDVEVIVEPTIVRFEIAAPSKVRPGMSVTLEWETLGVDTLTLATPEGTSKAIDEEAIAAGSLDVEVGPSGTFVLVGSGGPAAREVERSLVLELTDEPVIASFTAGDELQTAGPGLPATVTLSWRVAGARSLGLRATPGGTISLEGNSAEEGSIEVDVFGPTTFRLQAENPAGVVSSEAEAPVVLVPVIDAFSALPSRVGQGEVVTVSWETTAAAEVFLEEDGVALPGPLPAAGSHQALVAQEASFRLIARNSLGYEVSAERAVTVGSPIIEAFTADRAWAPVGGTVIVSWLADGGSSLTLEDQDGQLLHSTQALAAIRQGSFAIPTPSTVGDVSYTLRVSNGDGEDSRSLAISITDGPMIEGFSVSPGTITAGEELFFTWDVGSDAYGNQPSLTLRDQGGKVYDLHGADPHHGEASFEIPAAGAYEFTLEASTGAERFSTATAAAEVVEAAMLVAFTSDPPFVESEEQPVELRWQTLHAVSLQLLALDDEGTAGATLHTTTTDLGEGSFSFQPTLAAPHVRMVLENELGAEATFDLRIGVAPASVLSFTATPEALLRGEASTLEWTTARAERLRLEASPWVETDEAFIDVSSSENARKVGMKAGTSETGIVQFPDGFVFPFRGALHSSARAYNNGVVSFNVLKETGPLVVGALPNATFPDMHLAPFWAELSRSSQGGEVWYETRGAGETQHLVIQFKNFSGGKEPNAILNFEVVLWRDGSFDYRYGEMHHPGNQAFADGAAASIGHQDPRGSEGVQVSRNAAFPGGLSHRTLHFPVVPFELKAEAATGTFLDINGAADATEITEAAPYFATALIDPLPEGFTFPFAGSDRTALRVAKDGYLSFETGSATSENRNERLVQGETTLANKAKRVHLAPYWSNLSREHQDNNGMIWYALRSDERGRFLVVQWTSFSHHDHKNSNLNFQVLLREDGDFEYRYGSMVGGTGGAAGANGSLASIGWQEPNGVIGVSVSYNTLVPGMLNNVDQKGFGFSQALRLEAEGSLVVRPRGEVEYALIASNGHSSHRATSVVRAFERASVAARFSPAQPEPGAPLTIHWDAVGTVDLRLVGESGEVYRALPGELGQGSFTFAAGLPEGNHRFTIQAQGAMPDDRSEAEVEIPVYPAFQIVRFEPSAHRIIPEDGVILSWETINADRIEIEASSGGALDLSGLDPAQGSVTLSPAQTTSYTLTATSEGRILSEAVKVEVRSVSIDDLQATAYESPAGQPITLSWKTSGAGKLSIQGPPLITDVSSTSRFEDISGSGKELTGLTSATSVASVNLVTEGFTFPFLGEAAKNTLRVTSGGLLSFSTSDSGSTAKARFPNNTARGRIGVFWDSLNPSGVGKVYTKLIQEEGQQDRFVVQWKNLRFNSPTPASGDVNFQAVLFADGTFEYRYARMSGSSDETPPTEARALQAMGNTASIGYQFSTGKEGRELLYAMPFPGGLEGRAFRVSHLPLEAEGSVVVSPTQTTEYELCTTGPTWSECESVRVVVPQPGDLLISELQVNPVGGTAKQWLEVRNVSAEAIDLVGKTLRAGEASHTIANAHPLILTPGEYAVLAATGSTDFEATYVYGEETLDLAAAQAVELSYGDTVLARAAWDEAWFTKVGVAMNLDTARHYAGGTAAEPLSSWCESTAAYDGQNLGSPGAHGATCSSDYYDVDWFSDRQFIDISKTGVKLTELMARYKSAWIPEADGFAFPFFGTIVSTHNLWAATSSAIALGGFSTTANTTIDSPKALTTQAISQTGLIATTWAEAAPLADNSTLIHVERRFADGQEVLILQWTRMGRYNKVGHSTHQAQLWENGDIVIAWGETDGVDFNGSQSAVGIVGPGGGPVLEYFFKKPLIQQGSSILFKYR